MLKLDQAPGAVLATFGDRTDSARVDGPYKHAGPFTHGIIEAFGNITNGKLPDDLVGEFPASGVNAMMQAMTAFEPTNELEGMIAAQAVAMHHVTLDSLVRAQRCDRLDFRAQYVGMANKSARTFATLLETLNRHRGKTTTQRVIVENVTVEAGGQAVVGAVAGVGSSKKDGERAHEYTHEGAGGAQEGALVIALPCEDATGDAMSASSGERQEAMPNARGRSRQRRTAGKSERTKARPAHRRRDRGASDDARPAEGVAQSNRMNGAV